MGSRMCVAANLAHKALYLAFLHLIAHFKILPATDDEPPSVADPITGGGEASSVSTSPLYTRARFVPRNEFGIDL